MNAVDRSATHGFRPDWIPAEEYRGADVFALERERLWPRIWHMACRETELKGVGDFVNYEILDDTILIVRRGAGADDITAFYNVCQHRGRKLRLEYSGNVGGGITCRFHGWHYNVAGECVNIPFRDDWKPCPQFKPEALQLPKVKIGRWGGWIWLNQDENAESLEDYLGVVPERLDPFSPETARAVWWKTIHAPANWKIVLEAFSESYHAIPTHNSRIVYSMPAPTATYGRHGMFWFGAHEKPISYKTDEGSWMVAKSGAEAIWAAHKVLDDMLFAMTLEPTMAAAKRLHAEAPEDASFEFLVNRLWELQKDEFDRRRIVWPPNLTMEAVEKAGVSWHVFPNTIVLPTVDGFLWYRFRPHRTDPDQSIVDIWSFGRFPPGEEPEVANELFDSFEAFRGNNPFLEEDFPNIMATNAGVKCRGWKGARTNPSQEQTVNNFHLHLAEYLHRE